MDKDFKIPEILNQFNAKLENNKLILTYDKKKIQLKFILEILKKLKISFNEINTYESDLEDVFIELIKN